MALSTLTLTDFLLARIAEDEAIARSSEPDWPGDADLRLLQGNETEGSVLVIAAGRVLAECEARRRIVEHCSEILAVSWWEYDDAPNLADDVLSSLAAIYADHPDYREEWRP